MLLFMFRVQTGGAQSGSFKMNLAEGRIFYKSINIPADFNTLFTDALYEPDPQKRESMFQDLVKMEVDKYCLTNPIIIMHGIAVYSEQVNDCELYQFEKNFVRAEKVWLSK